MCYGLRVVKRRADGFINETGSAGKILGMVRDTGFEPVTPSVSRKCSTTELTAQRLLPDLRKHAFFTVFRETSE